MKRNFPNLLGKKFNRLTVVGSLIYRSNGNRTKQWICLCDCGNKTNSATTRLLRGRAKSCGCFYDRARGERNFKYKHGKSETNEFAIWEKILRRCYKSYDRSFHRYGGKGIKVCFGWRTSFENFYTDMGPRPSKKHSIDRIKNKLHYSCGHCKECIRRKWKFNCRWATATEQANNTSQNRFVVFKGERHTVAEWSRMLAIPAHTLGRRLRDKWCVKRALTEPVGADAKRRIHLTFKGETHCINAWAKKLNIRATTLSWRFHKGKAIEQILEVKKKKS